MVILILVNIMVSCYYYKITATYQPSQEELTNLSDLGKKFIVHQDYSAYYVSVVAFNNDSLDLHLGPTYLIEGKDIVPKSPNSVKRYRPKKGDARLLTKPLWF